jgi:hypothetical protein
MLIRDCGSLKWEEYSNNAPRNEFFAFHLMLTGLLRDYLYFLQFAHFVLGNQLIILPHTKNILITLKKVKLK